jgi:hypothetical protein
VLSFFRNINRRISSKLPICRIKEETSEHVEVMFSVFKFTVLPISIVYLLGQLLILKENAFDSMLLGMLVFFYSNFLPDLTYVFRKQGTGTDTDLPWYKKYALLLLAPIFILILFSNTQISWKTFENFHNLKSLTIYGAFLFLLGSIAFGGLPISVGQVTEMLSLPLYGAIGYLTHLRVDRIL